MFTSEGFELVAVTARQLCPRPLWEQIPRIREAGITHVILREKDLSPDAYTALAERVLRACEDCGTELILHSFPSAARRLGVHSLHMPLLLLSASLCREFDRVGSSVHSPEQLLEAEQAGVNYVTAGHIYATDCKKGLPPRGTAFLAELCGKASVPVYAIGGITAEKLPQLAQAEAAGACIMSGAMLL